MGLLAYRQLRSLFSRISITTMLIKEKPRSRSPRIIESITAVKQSGWTSKTIPDTCNTSRCIHWKTFTTNCFELISLPPSLKLLPHPTLFDSPTDWVIPFPDQFSLFIFQPRRITLRPSSCNETRQNSKAVKRWKHFQLEARRASTWLKLITNIIRGPYGNYLRISTRHGRAVWFNGYFFAPSSILWEIMFSSRDSCSPRGIVNRKWIKILTQ
jgi:hypothetical protein